MLHLEEGLSLFAQAQETCGAENKTSLHENLQSFYFLLQVVIQDEAAV